MNARDVRLALEVQWALANREAVEANEPVVASDRVREFFHSLEPEELAVANLLLVEWLSAEDEAKRWDAMMLIRERGVGDAVPALKRLRDRLAAEESKISGERARVERLIAYLGRPSETPTPPDAAPA
jgi:hypothetical protein